jgi:site-specific DNA-cytosine methylase
MNHLTKLLLLEQYITENGAKPSFTAPFLNRKNKHNVELQNWKDYQDLRKGIITIRQSGIRVKSPDYYPCLTRNPSIPIIYENGYRYLNQKELLELQSFPTNYQFPTNYSLTKIASLLGNSVNLQSIRSFFGDKWYLAKSNITNLKFVDLFAGLGGFHLVWKELGGKCLLAVDINKNCQETYTLNFPSTTFLLGDINNKKIQQQIIKTDFDLLCAGFPCQPFSRAGKKTNQSPELTSLLTIIKKKQPNYLLFENVPQFLLYKSSKFLLSLLTNYQLQMSILNPKDLGIKQNRPRLFIWGEKVNEQKSYK